jgi:hypothetical protein
MPMQRRDADPKDLRGSIIERIEAKIRQRLGGQVMDLQVAIHDGGVILRGRTRTHHAKQVALQAVMDLTEMPIRFVDIRAETHSRAVGSGGVPISIGPSRAEPPPEELRGDKTEPPGGAWASLFARMTAIWTRDRMPGH